MSLVKLRVDPASYADIVRRVRAAGADYRISPEAVNLNEVAIVPDSYAEATELLNKSPPVKLLKYPKHWVDDLMTALAPLVAIADAYDDNELDDEARKFWGGGDPGEHENKTPPEKIELYTGRGGRQLLTLEHCLAARRVVRGEPLSPPAPVVNSIRLTKPVGKYPVGSLFYVEKVIPHGGNYDDSVQYLTTEGTYIPGERAEVI